MSNGMRHAAQSSFAVFPSLFHVGASKYDVCNGVFGVMYRASLKKTLLISVTHVPSGLMVSASVFLG